MNAGVNAYCKRQFNVNVFVIIFTFSFYIFDIKFLPGFDCSQSSQLVDGFFHSFSSFVIPSQIYVFQI